MKMLKYYLIPVFLVILSSCAEDFSEINTNPNAPLVVQPELLLRQVIYDYGEEMSYEGFVAGNLLSQHFAMVDFNLFDRHDLNSPQLGGNPWPVIYTNLRDNERLLELAEQSAVNEVYRGPALILKAYMTAALTDIYGDVPYSEALKGKDGNTTPKYDEQRAIYLESGGILDNLDRAVDLLENYNGSRPLDGDILFDGDLQKWIMLANSLRIKYLMRISGQVDVRDQLREVFAEGRYITNSADDAVFSFTDTQPNTFRMAVLRSGDFNLYVMSETMEEILNGLNDPRRSLLFRETSGNPGQFVGLLNGQDASATSVSVADYSLAGRIFRENTGGLKANFMTSWETAFLLAEAAANDLINADAGLLYDQGVRDSFTYWDTELPEEYLSVGKGAFGAEGEDPIEQIITQKWLSGIINGYEGWIEYRRTGFPRLKTISASLNNDLIPSRMPYPAEEAALNAQSFQEATADNNNSINASVWWDQ